MEMPNDQHIFGGTIMCPIKQISTRMKALCRGNLLKAISTSMDRPEEFVYVF